MEYPLNEVTTSVGNHTKCREQVTIAKFSLSDIISSSTILENFNILIFIWSALSITQIFDSIPTYDSTIA